MGMHNSNSKWGIKRSALTSRIGMHYTLLQNCIQIYEIIAKIVENFVCVQKGVSGNLLLISFVNLGYGTLLDTYVARLIH